ncbi:SIR2 family protein [Pantoea endophytica]
MRLNQLSFSEYELNEILDSSQSNKLVLFVGAGFSKFSETELVKIPTWSELISELKEDLGFSGESDFLKIAQLYFLKYGQHSYVKKIKSTIRDLEPSHFHKQLFELNPHYIITTNWDELIEKTAQSLGLAYDLVSSDVDLAQSHLDKKIIKMHGDFRQNNFVFKEDDYLQYSQNFPLIENFVKGIFSTSTVVFLGYSYNDYDLKQIVSWVTTISKATPKKYLLQKNHDDAQALYLRNHGISLLTPENTKINYKELYSVLFRDFRKIQNQDELVKDTLISAEVETKKVDDNLDISDSDKTKLKNKVQEHATKKINKFIDSKIKALNQYTVLLPEQIVKKLTNVTIEHDKNGVTLVSNSEYLTTDYNEHSRKINSIYINDILSTNSNFTKNFSSILRKAFINNIKEGGNYYKLNEEHSELDLALYNKISFAYSNDSAEILLINKEYGKLLEILLSKVKYYLNEKNYVLTTIHMANFDNVYNIVKRLLSSRSNNVDERCKTIIKDTLPFDFKSKIIDFPRGLQSDLIDLVGILEFNEIYKAYYRFDVESKKNLEFLQIRKNGGMAYSQDEFKLRAKLYPYIYFIMGNEILIEEYVEIKNLFGSNILGSMEHYLAENQFYVNVMDIFSLIKYCETKKLQEYLAHLIKDKKIISANKINKKEVYRIKKYLLETLKNICNLLNLKNDNPINSTSIDRWGNNLLIVLSFVHWSATQLKIIINSFIPLLERRTHSMMIYENLQSFLSVNAFLYKKSHPDMLKYFDVVLNKIIKMELNGFDQQIILSNLPLNISTLSKNHNYQYENVYLLKSVFLEIKPYSDKWKKFITRSLLLDIKKIGTDEVKAIIDDFIKENVLNLEIVTAKDVMDRLMLIANGYPMPESFIEIISKFISDNIPKNLGELDFIASGFEVDFPELVKFLINDMGITELQNVLNDFYERVNFIRK